MEDPAPVNVPCPKCDGNITVIAAVAGDRLKLRSGGSCENCGCHVFTAGDLVVTAD